MGRGGWEREREEREERMKGEKKVSLYAKGFVILAWAYNEERFLSWDAITRDLVSYKAWG